MKKHSSLLLSDRIDYEGLVKEAFLGMMANVGKVIVKHPLASAGAAFNGMEIANAGRRAGRSKNLMRSVATVPTNM